VARLVLFLLVFVVLPPFLLIRTFVDDSLSRNERTSSAILGAVLIIIPIVFVCAVALLIHRAERIEKASPDHIPWHDHPLVLKYLHSADQAMYRDEMLKHLADVHHRQVDTSNNLELYGAHEMEHRCMLMSPKRRQREKARAGLLPDG